MKIEISKPFRKKLNLQIEYIAKDKATAARKFKEEILQRIKEVPAVILEYIAKQVEVEPGEFELYGKRENTKYDHLQEIIKEYRYVRFRKKQYR